MDACKDDPDGFEKKVTILAFKARNTRVASVGRVGCHVGGQTLAVSVWPTAPNGASTTLLRLRLYYISMTHTEILNFGGGGKCLY